VVAVELELELELELEQGQGQGQRELGQVRFRGFRLLHKRKQQLQLP
jgi:hypothetical protein